jgi:twitching motility protein PilT
VLTSLCQQKRGLLLCTGPTGSGKSTTLAALIDYINSNRKGHILTIEDPIEFMHRNKASLVTQREVGFDTPSFASALKSALREDPNVILVGEMRDVETISLAVTAAETGILVFGTLHTHGAAATVDRIVNVFPPGEQGRIRSMLSTSLLGVVSQQLLRRSDGKGRVAALEILVNNAAVANILRDGKTEQIATALQSGSLQGMQSMDTALKRLLDARQIMGKDAYRKAIDKKLFEMYAEQDLAA